MRKSTWAAVSAAILLTGCYGMGGRAYDDGRYSEEAYEVGGMVQSALRGNSGAFNGEVTFTQLDNGLRVVIRASGLAPGVHGAHIHERGDCSAPDFSSAGGHWNPFGRGHGRNNPDGKHMGDMPNLIVGEDGTGLVELTIDGASISGGRAPLLDEDGSAVVIHAAADDYISDPSGNAGPRVACGVVEPGY